MRTLLVESIPDAAEKVADTLQAAGHEVVRCHAEGAPAFPCVGLDGECPMEGSGPVDVAIAVRAESSHYPTFRESGATCALRTGIPLVVIAPDDDPTFEGWAVRISDPAELDRAVDQALAEAAERRAAPLRDEVKRVLASEGVEVGEVVVRVERDGNTARIAVWVDAELNESLAGIVATRVHAVDAKGSWPTSKVGVAVGTLR